MIDRILKIIEIKNINKNQFYKITGLSNGFLDKVKDIGASKLEYILKSFPDINPIWLLTGQGEILKEQEQPTPVQQVQPNSNDKYVASLEKINAMHERENAYLSEKIADLERRLALAEVKDKEEMDFKIKSQRKIIQKLLAEKNEVIDLKDYIIEEKEEEINAMKSLHSASDDAQQSQPNKRV